MMVTKIFRIAVSIFLIIFFVGCQKNNNVQATPKTSTSGRVTIIVENFSDASQEYIVEINENETVQNAMQNAQAQGLTYEVKEFAGLGSLVISVNGIAQTNTMVWIYAVNGKKATQGISMQSVRVGDRIEWTYEPSRF